MDDAEVFVTVVDEAPTLAPKPGARLAIPAEEGGGRREAGGCCDDSGGGRMGSGGALDDEDVAGGGGGSVAGAVLRGRDMDEVTALWQFNRYQ